MINYKPGRHINIFGVALSLCLISLSFLFLANTILAETDETAYWPVEVTSSWSAIYGTVTGITMSAGDSVGMFDSAGNCYGAGIYDGTYFHISAYRAEEADAETVGDFAIPGFTDGEEVTFKIYKITTYREYKVVTASGTPFIYLHQGSYPPIRIDLEYQRTIYESQARTETPVLSGVQDSWVGETIEDEVEKLKEEREGEEGEEVQAEATEEETLESIDEDSSEKTPPKIEGEEEADPKDHLHPEEMEPTEEAEEGMEPPEEIYAEEEMAPPEEPSDSEEEEVIEEYTEEDISGFDDSEEEKEIKRAQVKGVDFDEKPKAPRIPLPIKVVLLISVPTVLIITIKKFYPRK